VILIIRPDLLSGWFWERKKRKSRKNDSRD